MRLLTSGPGTHASVGAGAISYAGSPAAASTTTANPAPLSTKIRPPQLDQLWQHVFYQFGVADHGVLSAISLVVCRVGEGACGFGWVGCSS